MPDKNLSVECSVLESAAKQSEIEIAVRCKKRISYDVCVGALSVNFPMLYFMWFALHITVGSLGCHYRLAFHCWFIN